MACALVGDPDLLFLDEPTTGLDPQSRRQLWDIIRSLSEQHRTILITTHYMDEAERLCDRVAIVDVGRVIALGTPRELIATMGAEHVVEFALDGGFARVADAVSGIDAGLTSLPGVRQIHHDEAGTALTVTEPHVTIPALLSFLQARRLDLVRLTTRHVSLEDVFVHLTGKHLRDDGQPSA